MFLYIQEILHLFPLISSFVRNAHQQKAFMKHSISIEIDQIRLEPNNDLTDDDYKKINGYYGFAVPAILGQGFSILRGRSLSVKERGALTYLGALTGLFDDLFDKNNTALAHIRQMIETPETHLAQTPSEKLIIRFYQQALALVPDKNRLTEASLRVFDAQILSKKQTSQQIDRKEIESITKQKGGVSILFYRSVFDVTQTAEEQDMLMLLGYLGQLENDIFDIYDDYTSGIQTLATIETELDQLRLTYRKIIRQVFDALMKLDFERKSKIKFWRFVWLIACRGLVCLDCLEKAQKKTGGKFTIDLFSKKDLLCDMESLRNNFKMIHQFAKKSYKNWD